PPPSRSIMDPSPIDTEPGTPTIELLFELVVQTRPVANLAGVPTGDRTVVDVVAGSFAGPALRGTVAATGGDWLARSPGVSVQDVRLVLETDDGVTVLFRYTGRVTASGTTPRMEVAGTFDAPEGAYAWLNGV